MKKLSGFSLMEMMVVLLIVAIVAAASAPMINKRMVIAASEKSSSPWVRVDANTIAYNLGGSNLQTALVGTMTPKAAADSARFYIESSGTTPQIAFGQNDDQTVIKLLAGNSSVHLSDSVDADHFDSSRAQTVIGCQAKTNKDSVNSVALGFSATAIGNNSIAVGVGTTAQGESSVALGWNTRSNGPQSIAIGNNTNTTVNAPRAVVIGPDLTNIAAPNSVSIGSGSAIGTNSIAIGGGFATRLADRTSARSLNSIAIGVGANAYAVSSSGASASGTSIGNNLAIGSNVTTFAQDSLVIGSNSQLRAYGTNSILIGSNNLSMPGVTSQIGIGSDIDIGSYKGGTYSGYGSSNTVAIGHSLNPSRISAIAIGSNITAAASSVAIGAGSTKRIETGTNSTAIGLDARATHADSTAIGRRAQTTAVRQVVLGSANDTVYIPGNLIVAGHTVLGMNGSSHVWLNVSDSNGGNGIVQVGSGRAGNNILCNEKDETKSGVGTTYDTALSWFSDRRLKNVGKVFAGGLAEIKKLEVFNYTFKADESKTPRVGVMAQDLQKIFPNAVIKGEDGFLRIRMEDMFFALVNAVQELSNKFDTQDKQIAELTKQNQELQKTVTTLEKRLAELEKKVNAGK